MLANYREKKISIINILGTHGIPDITEIRKTRLNRLDVVVL